ncbi:DUF4145 domain-containing protein [Pseudoalteromonas sp. EB27]|uniref:DUF4145 domain-containing protein n=1 Tax=Pseudoalteromonas sp. EB27 TaxID=1938368 RepID=UPI000978D1EA|nr:DUF4145 domain-containing protein [Pseudoalteromonas sp. EB27]
MESILFPESIKEEYLADVTDTAMKLKYRAVAVRSCIELLLEHLFFQFIPSTVNLEKWLKLPVYKKIELIKENSEFDSTFYEELHSLRLIGNKGAHVAEHGNITGEELDMSFSYLSSVCTSLIFEYFKANGMQGTENTSTIFSCLQPTQRITVLNRYLMWLEKVEYDVSLSKRFYTRYVNAYWSKNIDETVYRGHFPKPLRLRQSINRYLSSEFWLSTSLQHYDELLIAIDKLSLAHLKSGSFFVAISTAKRFLANGDITENYYDQLCDKLNNMKSKVGEYPIAKSQKESIENLSQIESNCSEDLDRSFAKLIRCMLTNEN